VWTVWRKTIAARVPLGTSKSANMRLHQWLRATTNAKQGKAQMRNEHIMI
jgi:hypothetical protein